MRPWQLGAQQLMKNDFVRLQRSIGNEAIE
jgi:hypothetical protein